ncbi:MAG: ABC transporter permease [Thermoplasmata archaeon]|nr:ABC transporter permease [Thermoplasmata archaeon]
MRLGEFTGLHIFWMTVRESWKGFTVFLIMMILIYGGATAAYPSFLESVQGELPKAEGIEMKWEDQDAGIANLTWEPVEDALNYTVIRSEAGFNLGNLIVWLGGGSSNMTDMVAYQGLETYIHVPVVDNVTVSYITLIQLADGNMSSTGIVVDVGLKGDNAFNEMMNDPAYSGFGGGRSIDFNDIRSFVVFEVGSYFGVLTAIYIAFLAVGVVARDVERKSMDLVLSMPVTRRRFLAERTFAVMVMTFVALMSIGLIMAAAVKGVDDTVSAWDVASTFIGGFPLMLVIIAWSAIMSVVFNEVRTAMGTSFVLVLIAYIVNFASFITPDWEWMGNVTPYGYYNFADFIFGEWDAWGDLVVLLVLFGVLMAIAVYLFDRKELPT